MLRFVFLVWWCVDSGMTVHRFFCSADALAKTSSGVFAVIHLGSGIGRSVSGGFWGSNRRLYRQSLSETLVDVLALGKEIVHLAAVEFVSGFVQSGLGRI